MRSLSFIIAVLTASVICAVSHTGVCVAQESGVTYYEKGWYRLVRSDPNVPLVTKIDMEEMARQHLDGFRLVRKRAHWNWGREYVFRREGDKEAVFVKVGLHPSVREVEELVLDYLNGISLIMREGPVMGEAIGDNAWWSATSTPPIVTNIVFIRKNALFTLSFHSYDKVKALAKAIDDDIMGGASYITIKDSISPPVINAISVSKRELKEGEAAKITISATDPEGEPLEYQSYPGLFRANGDPENVFTLIASPDYIPAPFFGSHAIKVVAINENNAVSRILETDIHIFKRLRSR
jgi:hypothetical protein